MPFFTGSKERNYQQSLLEPGQQPLKNQLIGTANQGSFQDAANYYRDLLSNNSQTINQLNAPEMRRFNEDIIPGLAEQFAGMGSGGLSSSGFRNAAVNAGTDLSERLGAIRANLRSQGAQGLSNIGSQGLQQFSENIMRPGTEGFLGENSGGLLSSALTGLGSAFGGPALGALGNTVSNWFSPKKGSTSPYGGLSSKGSQMSGLSMGGR